MAAGRCLLPRSRNGTQRRLEMEDAIIAFARACRRTHRVRGSDARARHDDGAHGGDRDLLDFATMPTCGTNQAKNNGALHNELQFRAAASSAPEVHALLTAALLGVASITVAGPTLAHTSAARVCRARRLASALERRFGLRGLETWRFEIDAAKTPAAPLLPVAPRFCSRAPRCMTGGDWLGCGYTDFAVEERNVTRVVRWRDRQRRSYNMTRNRTIFVAPPMPQALHWGYYLREGATWDQWTQFG